MSWNYPLARPVALSWTPWLASGNEAPCRTRARTLSHFFCSSRLQPGGAR